MVLGSGSHGAEVWALVGLWVVVVVVVVGRFVVVLLVVVVVVVVVVEEVPVVSGVEEAEWAGLAGSTHCCLMFHGLAD